MLKSLFTRIKSEKQSTIKSNDNNQNNYISKNENNEGNLMSPQKEKIISQRLSCQAKYQKNIVKSSIYQVRYWADEDIQDIFTKVLSCPISYFNLLTHSKRKVKEIDLKKDKFPEYLKFMKPLLQQQLPTYNHILINHYPKGIGIMHHFDGPLYNDRVVVLSLGGPALISFQSGYSKQTQNMRILLQDKSIHIFQKNAYKNYLHGIQDKKIDAFTFTITKLSESQKDCQKQSFLSIKLKNKVNHNQSYVIQDCSINNLDKLNTILNLIQKKLNSLVFKSSTKQSKDFFCIDFDENQGIHKLKGSFIFIKQSQTQTQKTSSQMMENKRWKWKIQIQRQERISITIRQKHQKSQNF